jgi:NAD(P)-dependent dehydrogenase (short-subunit alcohol dehydrogenase family)
MKRLEHRRVVLTGATRGIGYETVKLFAAEGAEIIGVARDAERLKAIAAIYPIFQGLVGDVTDKTLGARVAQAVQQRWGAFDLLINNAAIQSYNQGFHDEPVDLVEKNLVTNVLSAHWLTHTLLPLLEKGHEPRIINVSSDAGQLSVLQSNATMPAYRLSKFALNGLSILYAGDLKGRIAVNAVHPGWLKTDLGGPQAPGEPPEGAVRLLEVATKPFDVTGRMWFGAEEMPF